MRHEKHALHCFTCGHTLAAGQKVDYFAQYATTANSETIGIDLLESIDNLLDHMEPVALTLGHLSTDCKLFLEDQDISHLGWLLWRHCQEVRRRLRYVIDELDARDREAREAATAQPAATRKEG
jgi:hypothetical protein